jgi:hypothetical protein
VDYGGTVHGVVGDFIGRLAPTAGICFLLQASYQLGWDSAHTSRCCLLNFHGTYLHVSSLRL